jgi:hypothetical protein
MAERKGERRVRCETQYVYDRLSSQKMSQVYHWLVPDDPARRESLARVTSAEDEKDRSHLRPSFL